MPSLPPHASHSQVNSWLRCGKAYYLERLVKVKQPPAAYLVAGVAIHTAIENINKLHFEQQTASVCFDRKVVTA
jgi:hypothetical protein